MKNKEVKERYANAVKPGEELIRKTLNRIAAKPEARNKSRLPYLAAAAAVIICLSVGAALGIGYLNRSDIHPQNPAPAQIDGQKVPASGIGETEIITENTVGKPSDIPATEPAPAGPKDWTHYIEESPEWLSGTACYTTDVFRFAVEENSWGYAMKDGYIYIVDPGSSASNCERKENLGSVRGFRNNLNYWGITGDLYTTNEEYTLLLAVTEIKNKGILKTGMLKEGDTLVLITDETYGAYRTPTTEAVTSNASIPDTVPTP